MANKTQAKAAVNSAATTANSAIDRLPTGVNIKDGSINFPTKLFFELDAGGVLATATTWRDSIIADLTSRAIDFEVLNAFGRRKTDIEGDIKFIRVDSEFESYLILNIGS